MDVLRRLEFKLVKAREWRDRARAEFETNVAHTTGVPHGCGRLAMRASGEEYSRAIRAAQRALEQHTEYILQGTIPEDLNSEIDDR